jgi:hypothetical protein
MAFQFPMRAYSASGLLAIALAVVLGPGAGALGALLAAMAAASGTATAGVGLAQLLTAAFGGGDGVSESENSVNLALDLASNPFSLLFGTVGATTNGGLKPGVELGKLMSASLDIAGSVKSLSKDPGSAVESLLSGSIGLLQIDYKALDPAQLAPPKVQSKPESGDADQVSAAQRIQAERDEAIEEQRRRDREQRQHDADRDAKRTGEILQAQRDLEERSKRDEEMRQREEADRAERQRRELLENERRAKAAEEIARLRDEAARQAENAARAQQEADEARREHNSSVFQRDQFRSASGGGTTDSRAPESPGPPINMLP